MPHIEAETTEPDLVTEVEELLAKATEGPFELISYEHGGGRLYREEPRKLIANFYYEGDRNLYSRTNELLRRMVEEVKRLREQWDTRINTLCGNCGKRYLGPRDDRLHGIGKCEELP